jgi:hypothetical protein
MRGSVAAFASNPISSPPRSPGYSCGTTPSNNPTSTRTRSGLHTGVHPSPARPVAIYQREWLRPDQPGRRLQRRDVIIQVTDDNEWIFPARGRGPRRHRHSPYPPRGRPSHAHPNRPGSSRCRTPRKFSPTSDTPTHGWEPTTKSSPPACVPHCSDSGICDTASHSQSDQTPGGPAPATPSRPQGCRSCLPPIRPGTSTTPTTFIQDSGALTTTARHVANRSPGACTTASNTAPTTWRRIAWPRYVTNLPPA